MQWQIFLQSLSFQNRYLNYVRLIKPLVQITGRWVIVHTEKNIQNIFAQSIERININSLHTDRYTVAFNHIVITSSIWNELSIINKYIMLCHVYVNQTYSEIGGTTRVLATEKAFSNMRFVCTGILTDIMWV